MPPLAFSYCSLWMYKLLQMYQSSLNLICKIKLGDFRTLETIASDILHQKTDESSQFTDEMFI